MARVLLPLTLKAHKRCNHMQQLRRFATGGGRFEHCVREGGSTRSGNELSRLAQAKQLANFPTQLWYFVLRSMTQISRDLLWFFTDLILTLISGFFLGLIPRHPAAISGNEQIVYWRESSAGMSGVAYFLAKNITHLVFIVLSPLLYLGPYLTFVSTRGTFLEYYTCIVVLQFATTGLGYLISIACPAGLSQLAGVVVVLVFSMFGGARPTLIEIKSTFPPLRIMPYISYIRWGQEALYVAELSHLATIQGIDINPSLRLLDYQLDHYTMCLVYTLLFGVGFRLIALGAMLFLHRDQKR